MSLRRVVLPLMPALLVAYVALPAHAPAQPVLRPVLAAGDVADIATLLQLEDRRSFDSTELARIVKSSHPEVRRRAALSIGRIVDNRGRALLRIARGDADTVVEATVVFSTGQLFDSAAVSWLDSLLNTSRTPVTVAMEAAHALGKIRTPESRDALERYLSRAPETPETGAIVGEALLSLGRYVMVPDLGPILRWTVAKEADVRWRAAWALYRPRHPDAVIHLLRLSRDPTPLVRNWAVRGLTQAQAESAGIPADSVVTVLRRLVDDVDRTVRTEALRALVTFSDSVSWGAAARALESPDSWLSISAAEGLSRQRANAAISAPRLAVATAPGRSSALRVVSLTALAMLAPDAALAPATVMAKDTSVMVRVAAVNFLRTRASETRDILTQLQNDPAPEVNGPARQALAALNDTAAAGTAGTAGTAGAAGAAAGRGRGAGRGGAGGAGARGGGGRGRGAIQTWRSEADYRQIVERWVLPDYNGAPRPRAEWTTARGSFEIELYAGDAPIAVDDFVRNVESGALVGVDFSRVVPDFVNQQRGISGAAGVRDEVNRHRLARGNLSWASAGLDTGRPGYTLGHTPQPHNEGGFTSLGRIVGGMDVVDRIELGDRVLAARMISIGR